MGKNIIHRLCVSASVPLIARKCCACKFHRHWGFVYIVERHLMCSTFSGHAYINGNHVLELLCWTSWLSILSYWPDSYRYWLCSVPFTTLLSHYPCKIVGLLRLHDGYYDSLHISASAVLSYTGDLFFPLLSVYTSCSSSMRYNIHFAFIN